MTVKPTIGSNHADGDIITGTQWNNDVVQQGLWTQEVLAGTNTDKIPTAAIAGSVGFYPNLLVNGGHEIDQRRNGATGVTLTTTGQICTDRWVAGLTSPSTTGAVQRVAGIGVGSQYSLTINYTHAATGNCFVYQNVENPIELRGRTLYFAADLYSPVAGTTGFLQLTDGISPQNSVQVLTIGLNRISVALTVGAGATMVRAILYMAATGVWYFDNCMLTPSPAAQAYAPRPYAEEMALCQRYYQNIKVSTRWRAVIATEPHDSTVFYRQQMPGVPTATLTTGGARTNISTASVLDYTADGARVEYTAIAGTATTGQDTAALNEIVTLEYNP